jgi:hypothetical protein
VLEGTAASGVFRVGDLITELGGEPITSSSDLVVAIRARSAGEQIGATVLREGEQVELAVTLGPHPTELGRALLGVEVVTPISTFDPEDLPPLSAPLEGPFVRGVVADGRLVLLDPVPGRWQLYAADGPSTSWAMIGPEIYTVEADDGGGPVALRALGSGERQTLSTLKWQSPTLVTSLGDLGIAIGQRGIAVPSTGTPDLETAVLAIDPSTGNLAWQWTPRTLSDREVLVLFGYANPARDRFVVIMAADGDVTRSTYAILDPRGEEVTGWPDQEDFVPEESLVFGWYDNRSLLYAGTGDQPGLFAFDIESRDRVPVTLPVDFVGASSLWTVGNGRHLIAQVDNGLVLVDTVGGETRPLAQNCNVSSLGDPGWEP